MSSSKEITKKRFKAPHKHIKYNFSITCCVFPVSLKINNLFNIHGDYTRMSAVFMEGATSPAFPSNKILSAQLMDVRWISLKEQTRALSKPCHQRTGLFVVMLYTPLPPVTAQDNQNPCSDLAKIHTAWLIIHQNSETILDIKKEALFFLCLAFDGD